MKHIKMQEFEVNKALRKQAHGHKPCCLWFTGLSGSGKSTLANAIEKQLYVDGRSTYILDGDNVRHGLCKDLGFTDEDRSENIRRVAEVAKLMVDAGLVVMVTLISPMRKDRDIARALFDKGEFYEIFIDASLEVCEKRDAKGLYAKARKGLIKHFTGIDSLYEPPLHAEFTVYPTDAILAMVKYITTELAPVALPARK